MAQILNQPSFVPPLMMANSTRLHAVHFLSAALVPMPAQPGEDNRDVLIFNSIESTIGRDYNLCDHLLNSVVVSREHAKIKYENNAWWIYDLFSTNGSFVQDIKLMPGEKRQLQDGCTVSFGPADASHLKYIFHENYHPDGAQSSYANSFSPMINVVDSSDSVDSMTTQGSNAKSSSQELKELCAETARLKVKAAELEAKLRLLKIFNRIAANDVKVMVQAAAKYEKKIADLKSTKNKFRILIDQLELRQSEAVSRRDSLDGQVDNDRANNEKHSGVHPAVESMLREITCSLCSQYFVSSTSFSCSHVFCRHCIDAWKKECRSKNDSSCNVLICPICRKKVQFQTQPLVMENLINILLENVLDADKLEERRKLVEERKKQTIVPATSANALSLDSFIQQIFSNLPEPEMQSDNEGDENQEDNGYENFDEEVLGIRLTYADLFSDVDDEFDDVSLIVNDDGSVSGDTILMVEDEDNMDEFEIVPSDAEDEPFSTDSNMRRRRASSMVLISDSEDSIQLDGDVITSAAVSSFNYFSSDATAPDAAAGSRENQRSHPYRRVQRSNSSGGENNSSSNTSTSRRHSVSCI